MVTTEKLGKINLVIIKLGTALLVKGNLSPFKIYTTIFITS